MTYPRDAFTLICGETEVAGLHGLSRYSACAFCKSWLWTEPDGLSIINIRTPMLDEPPDDPPILEVATDEGFEWAKIGARFSFAGWPSPEDYEQILRVAENDTPA